MKGILSITILFISFSILPAQNSFKDKRDGNVYDVINVNGVAWMAENLKYKIADGALFFEKDTNNNKVYGVLYDWKTATLACPEGWQLPAGEDFRKLTNFFEHKDSWGESAADDKSFGIQLGGLQDYEGTFTEMGESGYYWTSTEYDKENAEYFSYLIIDGMRVIDISRKADIADIHGTEKSNKYSVRCIKK